jgi:hypothetical protein
VFFQLINVENELEEYMHLDWVLALALISYVDKSLVVVDWQFVQSEQRNVAKDAVESRVVSVSFRGM